LHSCLWGIFPKKNCWVPCLKKSSNKGFGIHYNTGMVNMGIYPCLLTSRWVQYLAIPGTPVDRKDKFWISICPKIITFWPTIEV
jgi:hypothetical protein